MTETEKPGAAEPGAPRDARDRALDVAEACLWVGLLVVGVLVALAALRDEPGSGASEESEAFVATSGLVEAEDLAVAGQSRPFSFWLQPTSGFRGARWSKDAHMMAFQSRRGDWIELELPRTESGAHRLELFLTRAADYGIVAVSLNGARVGEEIDLWSNRGVVPTGAIALGVVELQGRGDVLRFEVIGSNPKASAPFFQFAIDGIRLEPQ